MGLLFLEMIFSAGLLHLCNGLVGAALPTALCKLPFVAAVVELEEGNAGALHGVIGSLISKE
jgi:hypothetical protein